MERYYKTNRDSNTGLKIKAILDRAGKFDEQLKILREKYGFGKIWTLSDYYKSVDAVEFKEEPDMTIWKKIEGICNDNAYYPSIYSTNKDVLNDFNDLKKLKIGRYKLDEIIGNDNYFNQAGFYFDSPGIYIFIVESDWKCNIPQDCKEITNIEYEKLTLE